MMSVEIPKMLQKQEFKFIKVRDNKAPLEIGWQLHNNYLFSDDKFRLYLQLNNMYGIATGHNNLIVIDFDSKVVQDSVIKKFPKTFTVKSAGKGLLHLYYKCDDTKSFKILDINNETLVDVQGIGKQIIGPGSKIPSGKTYDIVEDIEITEIKMEIIKEALSKYITLEKTIQSDGIEDDLICQRIKSLIKVPDLLKSYGVDTSKNPTSCLFHSSKGGRCLSFNDNVWHCFHCEKRGNIFKLAMEYNSLTFPEAKRELASRAGIDLEIQQNTKNEPSKLIELDLLPDIINNPISKPEWRVKDLVPEAGVTYIAAPPGEGKTMLSIYMTLCIASGRPVFGKSTKKGSVLYFDSENGEICLYNRFKNIYSGHDFQNEEFEKVGVSIFPYIRFDLDNNVSFDELNEIFNDFQPDVMFFDSLVRFMEGSENDAESCKKVFDFLRKFLEQNPKLSIVILHHLSKNNQGGMNAMRGSSELAASASSIVMLSKFPTAYRIMVEKSRYLDMTGYKPMFYSVMSNDEDELLFQSCEYNELPSDAVGRAEQDFWEWINKDQIQSFYSKDCENALKTNGHSKNAIFKLIKSLLEDKYIAKLKRGFYNIEVLREKKKLKMMKTKLTKLTKLTRNFAYIKG